MAVELTKRETNPELQWGRAPHLEYLNRRILRALTSAKAKGKGGRVIVEMPPQHGKTTYCSEWLPVWYLSRWPWRSVLCASYNDTLARKIGRGIRSKVRKHGKRLGFSLSQDLTGSGEFETDQGGRVLSSSIGGTFGGYGGDLIIIDDPIKSPAEAHSETRRDAVWDWYVANVLSRISKTATVVVVMTRWHKDDLVGRLLAKEATNPDADQWERVTLPAIAEEPRDWRERWEQIAGDLFSDEEAETARISGEPPEYRDQLGRREGEALWPDFKDEAFFRAVRASGTEYVWSALYQQDPRDRSGGMFSRGNFEVIPKSEVPAQAWLRPVRFWDLAGTAKKPGKNPSWTVGLKAGMFGGTLYVFHVARCQRESHQVRSFVRQTAEADGKKCRIWLEQEPGSGGKDTTDQYIRVVLQGFTVRKLKVQTNKVARAEPVSALSAHGAVVLVQGKWVLDFLDEIDGFPFGTANDQGDALSGAHKVLTTKSGALGR